MFSMFHGQNTLGTNFFHKTFVIADEFVISSSTKYVDTNSPKLELHFTSHSKSVPNRQGSVFSVGFVKIRQESQQHRHENSFVFLNMQDKTVSTPQISKTFFILSRFSAVVSSIRSILLSFSLCYYFGSLVVCSVLLSFLCYHIKKETVNQKRLQSDIPTGIHFL